MRLALRSGDANDQASWKTFLQPTNEFASDVGDGGFAMEASF
jgi:hypothetical protein